MILQRINIINFKSIITAACSFSPKVNCFIGLNGMGKTNLLDALHYLSFTRSHLGISDQIAVHRGAEHAIVEASYRTLSGQEQQLLLQIRPGHRKILKKNKKEYSRISEHIGLFPLVIISPQDTQLIQGSSEERRHFVDMQLSQQNPAYMMALSQYQKTLQQRNSLLKSPSIPSELLDVLDEQLDRSARYIYQQRAEFVEEFIPLFQRYYRAISGDQEEVSLGYETKLHEAGGRLLRLLRTNRERDRLLGHTTHGIHRDDLQMLLEGELLRRVGSEGQRKTFLISLKLAQYALQLSKNQETPLLLLDDIFDKLDAQRVERIIHLVGGEEFGQIFITDTNRKSLDSIVESWGVDYKLFSVENGNITETASSPLANEKE